MVLPYLFFILIILWILKIIKYICCMNKKQTEILKSIKDAGLTKEGIASKLGITPPHFSMMLNGKATFSLEARTKVKSIIDQAMKITV